jgi:hypothetical protein
MSRITAPIRPATGWISSRVCPLRTSLTCQGGMGLLGYVARLKPDFDKRSVNAIDLSGESSIHYN